MLTLRSFHGLHNAISRVNPKLATGAFLTAACIGIIVLYRFNPVQSSLYPPCPFHALTGFHCPGCGSVRAMHQLAHGNTRTALGLNPLMVVSLPFLIYSLASIARKAFTGTPLPMIGIRAGWIWSLLTVIVIFWILRNIPVYPFNLLAP